MKTFICCNITQIHGNQRLLVAANTEFLCHHICICDVTLGQGNIFNFLYIERMTNVSMTIFLIKRISIRLGILFCYKLVIQNIFYKYYFVSFNFIS